jgi:hypothetical protein
MSVIFTMVAHLCSAQSFELDTRELNDLLKKWDYANNWRSIETFETIYADRMIFYAQNLSKERCISLKRKFFATNRDFKQKILPNPVFTPYTRGVIKCDFVKDVFQNGKWKRFPSYLLITYQNSKYLISGESDLQTDRVLKYKLDIGKPMDIPVSEEITVTDPADTRQNDPVNPRQNDSVVQANRAATTETIVASDSITPGKNTFENTTLLSNLTNEILSDELISVPKKYFYFLIGFLFLTAIIVLFSGRKKSKYDRKGKMNGAASHAREAVVLRHEKHFESYVVSLFDPLYFSLRVNSRQKAMAGNGHEDGFLPGMEGEFRNKDVTERFSLECFYIPRINSIHLMKFSAKQINRYKEFEHDRDSEVYLVIGLEGDPESPKELYVIRSSELREGPVTYTDLKPFRKYGMFFYSTANKRLQ